MHALPGRMTGLVPKSADDRQDVRKMCVIYRSIRSDVSNFECNCVAAKSERRLFSYVGHCAHIRGAQLKMFFLLALTQISH
jgi:hypothetical protein